MATRIKEGMTGAEVAQIIDNGFDNLEELNQRVDTNEQSISEIKTAPFVFELMGIGTTKEEVNINYRGKLEGVGSTGEFQRTIPSASVLNAGVMTAYDKIRLDNACTLFLLDVDNYNIGETYNGEFTEEEVKFLTSVCTSGGIIALYINSEETLYSTAVEINDGIIKVLFSHTIIGDNLDLLGINTIALSIALDFKYTIKTSAFEIRQSGDGTKFLSDDGTYKEIELDTSTFATKADLNTKANISGQTFTGTITVPQLSLSDQFSIIPNTGDNTLSFQIQENTPLKITNTGIMENGVLLENKYAQFTDIPSVPTKTSQLQNDSEFVTSSELNEELETKQDNLISGTNIKTINGQSLLGSGDMTIEQSIGSDNIVDVTNICETLFTNYTISQQNYNYLKECVLAGKSLLAAQDGMGMLFQGCYSNGIIVISQYLPNYNEDALLINFATISEDLSVLLKKTVFSTDSAIPKSVKLSQYECKSRYAQIFPQDSINTAIGKLEAGIKDLTNNAYGTTQNRPSGFITTGYKYFDTTLNKPIWWNGTKWVDYNGNDADVKTSGTTSERPSNVTVGFQYFDTEINSPVYWNGEEWIQPATNTGVKVVKITQTEYDSLETKDPDTLYAIMSDSTIQ